MDTQENNTSNGAPQNSSSSNSGPVSGQKNTLMALLSYIGPLIIISYVSAKDDPFVKFHIKQGVVLLVLDVASWFLSSFMWGLWPILQFVNLAILVLAIIGIINAVQGKEKELPLVGNLAKNFNF